MYLAEDLGESHLPSPHRAIALLILLAMTCLLMPHMLNVQICKCVPGTLVLFHINFHALVITAVYMYINPKNINHNIIYI